MDVIAGIDPGTTGAVAIVKGGVPLFVADLKTTKPQNHKAALVDARHLAAILKQYGVTHIYCELVNAMPAKNSNGSRRAVGTQSMFNFGRSLGAIDGVAGTLGIEISYLTPMQWKRSVGLIRRDKDASRSEAERIYPGIELPLKKDHGKADALLIAYAGQRTGYHHATTRQRKRA